MSELKIGVDIGGTGIKGAVVDVSTGELVSDRFRLDTPQPATVASVTETAAKVVEGLDFAGPIGVGFPAVVVEGVALTANNIDQSWVGTDVAGSLRAMTGRDVVVVNDADAAGLAEATFGVARGIDGKVLVLTFGTGIGSALMMDGKLIPNFEFGQIEFEGTRPAERLYSARAREDQSLDWETWGGNIGRFIDMVQEVVNADLIVFGGGAVKEWPKFSHALPDHLEILPASLLNNAGIVGAALMVG